MGAWFLHKRLWVRYAALLGAALALFLVAWTASYLVLPDGILRGRTGGAALAGDTAASSFLVEWVRLAAINLAVGLLAVVGANLLRLGRMPMGYAAPLVWTVLYAVCLGTDSFAFPLPGGRMAPSLAVLTRSGPYEIAAFILAAVATYDIARYTTVGRWPRQTLEPRRAQPLTRAQWLAITSAVALLLSANASEAQRIIAAFA